MVLNAELHKKFWSIIWSFLSSLSLSFSLILSLFDKPYFDETVLVDLPQHPIFEGCDHLPTDKEIIDATHKLKSKAPGKSGIMTEVWKNSLNFRETFSVLKSIIINFLVTEVVSSDWNIGRLVILLEKGDL